MGYSLQEGTNRVNDVQVTRRSGELSKREQVLTALFNEDGSGEEIQWSEAERSPAVSFQLTLQPRSNC
jgi:hypothetical protein